MNLPRSLIHEHVPPISAVLRLVDVAAIVLAALILSITHAAGSNLTTEQKLSVVFVVLLSTLIGDRLNLYRAWRRQEVDDELLTVLMTWIGVLLLLPAGLAFIEPDLVDHTDHFSWLATWLGCAWAMQTAVRLVLAGVATWLPRQDWSQRRVVLAGLTPMGIEAVEQVRNAPRSGMHVIGYFDDRADARAEPPPDLPRLGRVADIPGYMDSRAVDEVWIGYPFRGERRTREALHALRDSTVDIRCIVDMEAFHSVNQSVTDVAGVVLLDVAITPMEGVNRLIKALEDRLLAGLFLLLASPLMLAIAIGVAASSPGPVLYRQERVGWNNRPFMMLKFRTMPVAAERESGPVWAKRGERRATAFGSFLRKTSLDELPQFINVLRGEMSIVGPRPERPCFVDAFREQIPAYMKKHMVKAGITGWAQVNGWRGDTDIRKRIEHDLYYIGHWSLWLDIRIAFMTVIYGFFNRNAY